MPKPKSYRSGCFATSSKVWPKIASRNLVLSAETISSGLSWARTTSSSVSDLRDCLAPASGRTSKSSSVSLSAVIPKFFRHESSADLENRDPVSPLSSSLRDITREASSSRLVPLSVVTPEAALAALDIPPTPIRLSGSTIAPAAKSATGLANPPKVSSPGRRPNESSISPGVVSDPRGLPETQSRK